MKDVARLLDRVKPTRYQLELAPDLETFTFSGRETIEFEIDSPSRQLTFHAVDLEITKATIGDHSGTAKFNKADQTVTFNFDQELSGSQKLELAFSGELKDKLHGFYRSKYRGPDGEDRWLATTQFEPTAAREAFVCIDEPAAKAEFEVSLVIPQGMEAISNTNILSTTPTPKGTAKTVRFAPTPKMSTYLLAFLVGNFERITTKSKHGVEVGVYTTAGKKHQGEFALQVAADILDFYDDYFGIPYPLPKLDMIAVPDFAAGAMENWGAVTYREPAILVDPEHTALANKQLVAMVVAHELAHQWFGNLVTMKWWTDLWLNEGFASWVEFLAVDHLYPEWQMWTQFVANDYAQARSLDSLANTHPIEVEVHNPDEIGEIFDAISYQKGASVIRMLYHFIGEDAFKSGLRDYLSAFSYGNAVTDDLWRHLEQSSGMEVTKIMQAWTKQPGYPLVTIDDDKVSQQRFFANPKQKPESTTWPIPLSFSTSSGPTKPLLISHPQGQLDNIGSGLHKPNADQTGFYVVNYSPKQLAKLGATFKELSVLDRWGVISDLGLLMPSAYLPASDYLKTIAGLRDETNYAVWLSILDGLGGIFVLADDDTHERLEEFTVWLVDPILNKLGWEARGDETHLDTLLRNQVLSLAGRAGNQTVIQEAQTRFDRHRKGDSLDPDLRGAVYAIVARHGSEDTYRQLAELLDREVLQEEERRLLGALGRFKQPELIQQTLDRSISDKVRTQDTVLIVASILGNRYGRGLAWDFIRSQWQLFVDRYGSGGHLLSRLPEAIGGVFARHEHAVEVERFFDENDKPGIERTVQQALEQIRLQADWWERDKNGLKRFLASDWQKL